MAGKTILLIEDDPKTAAAIKEVLGEYQVETVSKTEAAADFVRQTPPDLIIVDFDLKEIDGLQVFRQIHPLAPEIKVIMLSVSNNVPLAVRATKLGVSDFQRKPVDAGLLRQSVEKNILAGKEVIAGLAEAGWLQGESPRLKRMYSELQEALSTHNNLILFGERGIEKRDVVEFLHAHSLGKRRKLMVLDLSSFSRENMETYFWATAQEVMAEPGLSALQNEEDRCGTFYLENIENLDENFRLSILEFLKERKGKVDKEVLVVVGVYDRTRIPASAIRDCAQVEIPPLRERKEDLSYLESYYLKLYSTKYNKPVKGISADLLEYLSSYDYPGNYQELESLIESGILLTSSEILDSKDIPIDFKGILGTSIKKAFRKGKTGLEGARREFEKDLYRVLLSKTDGDAAAAARFLDVPRTAFTERLEDLGQNLMD